MQLTTMSFPVFSGLFANLIAAAAAAPDDIPTCQDYKFSMSINGGKTSKANKRDV